MKRQLKEATIVMENVVETLSKDLERVSLENLPDVAPVSDNSASSAGSGSAGAQHVRTPSESSEVESVHQVDEKEWSETKARTKEETSSNQSGKDSPLHVSWGDVEIRFFPIVPGDHPDAQGVPVRRRSCVIYYL